MEDTNSLVGLHPSSLLLSAISVYGSKHLCCCTDASWAPLRPHKTEESNSLVTLNLVCKIMYHRDLRETRYIFGVYCIRTMVHRRLRSFSCFFLGFCANQHLIRRGTRLDPVCRFRGRVLQTPTSPDDGKKAIENPGAST